jgi:hypothetical protein
VSREQILENVLADQTYMETLSGDELLDLGYDLTDRIMALDDQIADLKATIEDAIDKLKEALK